MNNKVQRLAPRRDWRQVEDESVDGVLEDEPEEVAHHAEDRYTDAYIYLILLEGPRSCFVDRRCNGSDRYGYPNARNRDPVRFRTGFQDVRLKKAHGVRSHTRTSKPFFICIRSQATNLFNDGFVHVDICIDSDTW